MAIDRVRHKLYFASIIEQVTDTFGSLNIFDANTLDTLVSSLSKIHNAGLVLVTEYFYTVVISIFTQVIEERETEET